MRPAVSNSGSSFTVCAVAPGPLAEPRGSGFALVSEQPIDEVSNPAETIHTDALESDVENHVRAFIG